MFKDCKISFEYRQKNVYHPALKPKNINQSMAKNKNGITKNNIKS